MYKTVKLATLTEKKEIAQNVFEFYLKDSKLAAEAKPGQFVHVDCEAGANLLRRPISICDVEGDIMRIVFQIKGAGTHSLSEKKPGDVINLLGPLGTGFTPTDKKAVVIGGGIGVFPLLMLAKRLNNPQLFMGYRNKEAVMLEDEFAKVGTLKIATDDGSYGHHGLVTELAREAIKECDIVYACGPTPMLKSVQAICKQYGKKSELSMEQRMGCGVGACLACVCETVDGYGKVCQHGPVFNGDDLIF